MTDTDDPIVTTDDVWTRGRELLHEHPDITGVGAARTLRGLLYHEFATRQGRRALSQISDRSLGQMIGNVRRPRGVAAGSGEHALPSTSTTLVSSPPPAPRESRYVLPLPPPPPTHHGSPDEMQTALGHVLWLKRHGYISHATARTLVNEVMDTSEPDDTDEDDDVPAPRRNGAAHPGDVVLP